MYKRNEESLKRRMFFSKMKKNPEYLKDGKYVLG